jgi:hypothetical protein
VCLCGHPPFQRPCGSPNAARTVSQSCLELAYLVMQCASPAHISLRLNPARRMVTGHQAHSLPSRRHPLTTRDRYRSDRSLFSTISLGIHSAPRISYSSSFIFQPVNSRAQNEPQSPGNRQQISTVLRYNGKTEASSAWRPITVLSLRIRRIIGSALIP